MIAPDQDALHDPRGADLPVMVARPDRLQDVGDDVAEVDLLGHQLQLTPVEPGGDQHVLDPVGHPAGLAVDQPEQVRHPLGGQVALRHQEQRGRAPDRGQRAAQLVPEHRHQVFRGPGSHHHRRFTGW